MPANTAPANVDFARQSQLWNAIQQIPDGILADYLADNIIDDQEIEDITLRLESHMNDLTISESDHQMIRQMVRQAVEHIKAAGDANCAIEGKLGAATLSDIRSVMGDLVNRGQIKMAVEDASITEELSPNEAIPDERPDDYDEEAPNLLDEK